MPTTTGSPTEPQRPIDAGDEAPSHRMSGSSVWPILHYDDTNVALRYLVDVLGFHELVVATDDDGGVIHAELGWPGGGVLVFGSTKHVDSVHGGMRAGTSALYVITDDVDAVHERVRQAGDDIIEPPHETRFGSGAPSYVFTAKDHEGNLWTFGTLPSIGGGPSAIPGRRDSPRPTAARRTGVSGQEGGLT